MNFEPFLKGRGFSPEQTRIMGLAFEKARAGLHDSGQHAVVQEIIAKRIVDLAMLGGRDPEKLAKQALQALGIESP
jgi:hypothetical protein